ncbi:MAG TPA: hypothetical protein VNG04_09450, partial [Candidatus Acidoferrum sp.]|nr:hypothetical protein [Candidatus Acidoferrum sp.]
MATEEEILSIVLAVKSQGLAEADAVNAILAKTGNQSLSLQTQVQGLTKAQSAHNLELQTANTLTASYGGKLTAQEAAYARLQLSGGAAAAAERGVAAEANAAARAAQAMGAEGAKAFERMAALGGAVTGAGGFGLGIGAAVIGGGVAIELGKSMIDNADKNETAQRGLEQAFQSQGKSLFDYQGQIDSFLNKNRRFISDQYEVKDAFATATRAGNDWGTTQRIVNDALDLSAAKHISVKAATSVLVDAEKGRTMGLLDLGIATKDIVDPQKELEKATTAATKAGEQKQAADRSLAETQVRLAEKHHISNSELMHLQDLQKRAANTTGPAHEQALRTLSEAQVRVADSHRITQSELMHLQDVQAKATDAAK